MLISQPYCALVLERQSVCCCNVQKKRLCGNIAEAASSDSSGCIVRFWQEKTPGTCALRDCILINTTHSNQEQYMSSTCSTGVAVKYKTCRGSTSGQASWTATNKQTLATRRRTSPDSTPSYRARPHLPLKVSSQASQHRDQHYKVQWIPRS